MEGKRIYCESGGCTAKLGAKLLENVLSKLPEGITDENLITGFEKKDDGAVYRLSSDTAVIQTLDFFPPMVEDPYIFGQIAAANAVSDIFAMGGEVRAALNIVCFPEDMELDILGMILEGGQEKLNEAGGVLAGGHSIADDSIKYGLSVMGTVHPDRIYKNGGCREGDVLVLTKKLGTGIICAANRVGEADAVSFGQAVESMCTLNRKAAEISRRYSVSCCTDVTGFGFLGHLSEMLDGKHGCRVFSEKIPVLEGALSYAEEFLTTGGGQKNRNHVGGMVDFGEAGYPLQEVLFDPQTSGGLLIGVPADEADSIIRDMNGAGVPAAAVAEVAEKRSDGYSISII